MYIHSSLYIYVRDYSHITKAEISRELTPKKSSLNMDRLGQARLIAGLHAPYITQQWAKPGAKACGLQDLQSQRRMFLVRMERSAEQWL